TWANFDTVTKRLQDIPLDGLGFVLTPKTGIVGFDWDDVLENGQFQSGEVKFLVELLRSYTELSPSGCGIRALALGRLPRHGRVQHERHFEVYSSHRYVSITGHKFPLSTPDVEDRPEAVARIHAHYWPKQESQSDRTKQTSGEGPSASDDKVI